MQWRYDDNTGRLTVNWVNTDGTMVGPLQHFICTIIFPHHSSYMLNPRQIKDTIWDRLGAVTSLTQYFARRPPNR